MSWLLYVPYAPMPPNINLEISSAVYQRGCIALCTFEESIDILSLVTPFLWSLLTSTTTFHFRCPPLWASLYLPLSILLQVPGFPFKYFLQDEPLAEHSLHHC